METVKQDSLTLQFSFVGMKTKEVKWTGKDVEYCSWRGFSGYGGSGGDRVTRRLAERIASAISTIKAKDIMVQGVGSIDQMLQGRVPV